MTLFPVLVDVYHKEQLVTKEEAQEAASDELQWMEIAVTKDSVTATRIADILDEYDHAFENYIPQHIRGEYVYSHLCLYIRIPFKYFEYYLL